MDIRNPPLSLPFLVSTLMTIIINLQILPCFSTTSFVFGDSLVDAGNNNYLVSLSRADFPPNGIDFPPNGRPTGRFTNGRTIADIVGEGLGVKPFPPPYFAPNAEPNAVQSGLNYASGASGILDETGSLFIGRVPLRQQISNFEQSRRHMVKVMGERNTSKFLKEAIFSVTIGANDVLNYIQPLIHIPFLHDHPTVSPSIFQDFLISNLTTHLKRLHGLGGRKFVIVDIGPLGCIPFVRAIKFVPKGKCSVEVNTLIRGYNSKLKAEIHRLNREIGPKAIFVYANTYDAFRHIILNYRYFGFENNDDPCCGGYVPPFLCRLGNNENVSSVMCNERGKYVFWDAYHPSEATNLILSEKLLNGDITVAWPMNLSQLHHYKL
ncbi:GDSL esterase/lipase At5g41890 [Ipomoea triloba]|uniref:GDSL esterase/lipase At5g41890 n=1 Tax=Ipomoea triloba TaxID=35885 RepID=UPI00125DB556|nr:GDSL esterase/lipase At5g41890 [Ipomoea triloba]